MKTTVLCARGHDVEIDNTCTLLLFRDQSERGIQTPGTS
jgi:hypothetical protein